MTEKVKAIRERARGISARFVKETAEAAENVRSCEQSIASLEKAAANAIEAGDMDGYAEACRQLEMERVHLEFYRKRFEPYKDTTPIPEHEYQQLVRTLKTENAEAIEELVRKTVETLTDALNRLAEDSKRILEENTAVGAEIDRIYSQNLSSAEKVKEYRELEHGAAVGTGRAVMLANELRQFVIKWK